MNEDFKTAFRTTDVYLMLRSMDLCDEDIFKFDGKSCAYSKVEDARLIWTAATKRAAAIAIRMTEIPPNARNPTRDRIVEVGEEISEAILK